MGTMLDIDGDEFAEMDYDIIVDNDMGDMELKQKLEQLAHAGLQNQMLSFSTVMKIFGGRRSGNRGGYVKTVLTLAAVGARWGSRKR